MQIDQWQTTKPCPCKESAREGRQVSEDKVGEQEMSTRLFQDGWNVLHQGRWWSGF